MAAFFSPCRTWRYRLDRTIKEPHLGPVIGFLPHNPSNAAEETNDPSARRMINFVAAWGGSRLIVLNPWAFVATKPADLWKAGDPVGPQNDAYIEQAAREIALLGGFMVCAWGAVHPPYKRKTEVALRLQDVIKIVRDARCPTAALKLTLSGQPCHPLYLKSDLKPFTWPA